MSRLLFCLCLAVATGPAVAGPGNGLPEEGAVRDTTRTFATDHKHLLKLPQLLWRVMVYPVGELTIYTERQELPQRINRLFTNDAGTFGVFPQLAPTRAEATTGIKFRNPAE